MKPLFTKLIRNNGLKLGLLFLLVVMGVSGLGSGKALADSETISNNAPMPNSSTVHGVGSQTPYYAVGTGDFDGTYSWVKVYVPNSASPTIYITQNCGIDVGSPRVTYYLQSLSADESGPTAPNDSHNYAESVSDSGSCNGSLSLPQIGSGKGIKSTVTGHTSYRVFFLLAKINNASGSGDNERSFRLKANNSNVEIGAARAVDPGNFPDIATKFTGIYQRDAPSLGGSEWDYRLQFAPTCDEQSTNGTRYVTFYDMDNGVYSPQDLQAVLQRKDRSTPGASWSTFETWSGSDLGGNHDRKTEAFTANNKYVYRLVVTGVNWHNTIQIRIPFDQLDALPTTYPGSGDCSNPNQISGNVSAARCQDNINVSGVNDNTGAHNFYVKLTNNNGKTPNRFPSSGTYNTSSKSIPVPAWVKNRTGGTDVGVQLYVTGAGSSNPISTANISEPWAPCNPPPTSSTCPTIPTDPIPINLTGDNTKVPTQSADWTDASGNLHQKNSYINDHLYDGDGSPEHDDGDADDVNLKSNGDIVWGESANVPDFKYVIQGIKDQYGQDLSTPNPHWSPQDKSANPFNVNWSPFINMYPYDSHAITVTYTTWYLSYKYKADTPVYGKVWVSGYWAGSGRNRHWVPGYWSYPLEGYRLTYQNVSNYDWHTTPNDSETHTGNSNWARAECYNRNFEVTQASVNNVSLNDNENPSQATFGFHAQVDFSLNYPIINPQDPPLRNAQKICGLGYNTTYYVKHADGSTGASLGGKSGTLPCINGDLSGYSSAGYDFNDGPISTGNLDAGDEVCTNFTVAPQQGQMDEQGNQIAGTTSGSISGSGCSAPVVNEPYALFFGGDVSAGGGFGSGMCNAPGGIYTYSKSTTTGQGGGSGSQFGALALGGISGFSSASLRGSSPTGPLGLTFSNTNNISGGPPATNLGGNLGGSNTCAPDYFNNPGRSALTPTGSITVGSLNNSAYYNLNGTGTASISGNKTVAKGAKTVIYINGNLYINGNVTYDTSWSSLSDIQSLYVVVLGNIYINPGVTQLDGIYIAQPTSVGTAGQIYTCATNSGPYDVTYGGGDANNVFNNCKNQLTVNGGFIAQQVILGRTLGSLRNSQAGETMTSNSGTCANQGTRTPGVSSCAAEIFNFGPEDYIAEPGFTSSGGAGNGKFDYITSLSPVF